MAFDLLTGLVRDFRATRRVASEIARLNHMNATQLADLGLERSDITDHAFRKHFRGR
jgi:uncharacterized protein YjiS (DUF1127 family)